MNPVCGKEVINMQIKESNGQKAFNIINVIVMLFLVILTLYPMLYVLFASLSKPNEYMAHQGILLRPLGFTLGSYKAVLKNPMIAIGYRNTIFVVVVGIGLNIFMTALGAYVLSRKGLMLKGFLMFFIVFTMFFSGGLIPFYFTVKELGLDNKLWALIIPGAISTYNLIIMRTAFNAVPDSLEESAKLDGASHYTILFKIMIPLTLPTIAVMVLYYGVAHWNAWFNAMIFIRNRDLYPLQLILREILIANDTNSMIQNANAGDQEMLSETIKFAVIIVSTLPILALYPFLQKYFVKGVMIGAVKG
jgi:putative aldouronate transport system permease protein